MGNYVKTTERTAVIDAIGAAVDTKSATGPGIRCRHMAQTHWSNAEGLGDRSNADRAVRALIHPVGVSRIDIDRTRCPCQLVGSAELSRM